MDYVLLTPDEAAALLNVSAEEIISLIEVGELGGLRVSGHWRVPLKSITELLESGMKTQTVRALERVFNDHSTWNRVFGSHPEVTQIIEAGEFPQGSVGAYLKEAISISRSQRTGQVAQGDADAGLEQDDSYLDERGSRLG